MCSRAAWAGQNNLASRSTLFVLAVRTMAAPPSRRPQPDLSSSSTPPDGRLQLLQLYFYYLMICKLGEKVLAVPTNQTNPATRGKSALGDPPAALHRSSDGRVTDLGVDVPRFRVGFVWLLPVD